MTDTTALRDEAAAAVARRHPDLTGPAFERKVDRTLAILRHSQDGTRWTATTTRGA